MESMTSISFGGDHGVNYGSQIGINYGSIEFRPQAPERPETPPTPLSTVPFPHNPDFVHRGTLVDQIHHKRTVPGSRIALVGLGGVGKSQLAIEYCHQVRSESPATWIFWVHASNQARFEQSFRDIADDLKLPRRWDPKVNTLQLVENWLRDKEKGTWICVIDNVDDEFLCSIPSVPRKHDLAEPPTNISSKPLLEYIPRRPNGFTILTSRSRKVALKMVNDRDLIDVQPMGRSEALDLFKKKMDHPEDSLEGQQLIEMLEFMPLAIVQATSYIRYRAPRYSVAQYLTDFQSDQDATELLREEISHTYRDWEAKNSILDTWQISFNYIRQVRPSAADLLSLMCFFDRQGIPDKLIRHHPPHKSITKAELSSDCGDSESLTPDISVSFEHDVDMLRDFSFISVSEDGSLFMMHRLVQLSTRAWLKSHRGEEQWQDVFIKNLAEEFPSGDYGTWEYCQSLYPHVKTAMLQQPESWEGQIDLSNLLYRGAWYAHEMGLFDDMEKMALKSENQRVKLFGPESEIALMSTALRASSYHGQGRLEEAKHLKVQVMETLKIQLGEDHPSTLRTIASLAFTYWSQGLWKEAEQLEVQALETLMIKLGKDDPDTLMCMANLASTYQDQGRWEEAEQLQVQAMETRKIKLGEDHLDTLFSMTNLAFIYWNQGRWEEAEQLQVQAMETHKTKLGENHADTLKIMAHLASTWKCLGRNAEAIALLQSCLAKQEEKLGLDHPNTINWKHTLDIWQGKNISTSSSSPSPEAPTQSRTNEILSIPPSLYKSVPWNDRRRGRTILSRLFRRK